MSEHLKGPLPLGRYGKRKARTSRIEAARRSMRGKTSAAPVSLGSADTKPGDADARGTQSRPPNLPAIWALIVLSLSYLHHSTTG